MSVQAVSPQQGKQVQQARLFPFRKGTRQHFDRAGEVAYVSNRDGAPLRLPQFGFLNALLCHVTGTMTLGTTPALAADGPWALVSRIRVTLNTGIEILNLTGYGAFLVNLFGFKEEFSPAGTGQTQVYAAPVVASSANAWNFMFWLPIAANDGQNFEVGLINLQTEELVASVEVVWAAETAVITGASSQAFVGRMDIHMLWYEVPDPRRVQFPPLNIVHRLMEDRIVAIPTESRYTMLRQGTMQQLAHVLRLNGSRNTNDVVALRLELNRSDRVYRYLLAPQLFLQYARYGQDLPTGVFVWDWWHSQMDVAQGDGRDFVDTEAVAQIDSVVEIAAGATFGSNNNFLDTIRRHTLVLKP